jgi:hypothetical protein
MEREDGKPRSANENIGFQANKLFSQGGQSIHHAKGRPAYYLKVTPFNVAKFAQAIQYRDVLWFRRFWRCSRQQANHPLSLVLSARRDRPRRCRAPQQRDELAPVPGNQHFGT